MWGPNVKLVAAFLGDPFGTHHSKILVLFRREETVQIVVHTGIALILAQRSASLSLSPSLFLSLSISLSLYLIYILPTSDTEANRSEYDPIRS